MRQDRYIIIHIITLIRLQASEPETLVALAGSVTQESLQNGGQVILKSYLYISYLLYLDCDWWRSNAVGTCDILSLHKEILIKCVSVGMTYDQCHVHS